MHQATPNTKKISRKTRENNTRPAADLKLQPGRLTVPQPSTESKSNQHETAQRNKSLTTRERQQQPKHEPTKTSTSTNQTQPPATLHLTKQSRNGRIPQGKPTSRRGSSDGDENNRERGRRRRRLLFTIWALLTREYLSLNLLLQFN